MWEILLNLEFLFIEVFVVSRGKKKHQLGKMKVKVWLLFKIGTWNS